MLNLIKTKTLESFNAIFRYIFEEVPNQTKNESPFLQKGLQLCPYFISTVVDIAQREDIEELIADEVYQDIIVEAMECLTLFTGEKEFYEIIVNNQRALLVHVCLNLLKTTKSEYD